MLNSLDMKQLLMASLAGGLALTSGTARAQEQKELYPTSPEVLKKLELNRNVIGRIVQWNKLATEYQNWYLSNSGAMPREKLEAEVDTKAKQALKAIVFREPVLQGEALIEIMGALQTEPESLKNTPFPAVLRKRSLDMLPFLVQQKFLTDAQAQTAQKQWQVKTAAADKPNDLVAIAQPKK